MKDVIVRNYILPTTEQTMKETLYGLETCREMWTKMENQYAARAEDLEHIYYQELYDIKYDKGLVLHYFVFESLIVKSLHLQISFQKRILGSISTNFWRSQVNYEPWGILCQ